MIRFRTSGKLKPRFIGPFQILDRIGSCAYRLALPPSLDGVHNVFHVSMLKKYVRDENHIITNFSDLELQSDLTYEEKKTDSHLGTAKQDTLEQGDPFGKGIVEKSGIRRSYMGD